MTEVSKDDDKWLSTIISNKKSKIQMNRMYINFAGMVQEMNPTIFFLFQQAMTWRIDNKLGMILDIIVKRSLSLEVKNLTAKTISKYLSII